MALFDIEKYIDIGVMGGVKATTWQVSFDDDFVIIIAESLFDTVNKFRWTTPLLYNGLSVAGWGILCCRVKLHYDGLSSGWFYFEFNQRLQDFRLNKADGSLATLSPSEIHFNFGGYLNVIRQIQIKTENTSIILPKNNTHVSTDWFVIIKRPSSADIELSYVGDVDNLTSKTIEVDLYETDVVYCKYNINLENDTTHISSVISSGMSSATVSSGMRYFSGNILNTPIVDSKIDVNVDGTTSLRLTSSPMSLYSGMGSHSSTSWYILDSSNVVVSKRERDVDNLTSFTFDITQLDSDVMYYVKVIYHNDSGSSSLSGRTNFARSHKANNGFVISTTDVLISLSTMIFEVDILVSGYSSVDIALRDSGGSVVQPMVSSNTNSLVFNVGDLDNNVEYTFYGRIKLNDGTVYKFVPILTSRPYQLDLLRRDFSVNYHNTMKLSQTILTNGVVNTYTEQLNNGHILIPRHDRQYLCVYDENDGILTDTGITVPTPDSDILPSVTSVPISNNSLLLTYQYRKDGMVGLRLSTLLIKPKMDSYIPSLTLDLPGCSGVGCVNSITRVSVSSVLFIPDSMIDGSNLKVYEYSLLSGSISSLTPLPFNVKNSVNVVYYATNKVLIFGGYNAVDVANNETQLRGNNDIWIMDTITKVFTKVGSLSIVPSNVYRMQTFLRRNGNIACYNATYSKTDSVSGDYYVIDTTSFSVTAVSNTAGLPYSTTIPLTNGTVLRVSCNVEDPQSVIYDETDSPVSMVGNVSVPAANDLLVDIGAVVEIENPYIYSSVVIKGDSLDNTGTLIWSVNDQPYKTFKYNDLLITRSSNSVIDMYGSNRVWRTVTVLSDTKFNTSDLLYTDELVIMSRGAMQL
jgi:hypothetical protein